MAGATVKQDGITGATWLINLSAFTGLFYRKYSHKSDSKFDLITPMMNYIYKQLSMENVHQLLVLKDVLEKTVGIRLYEKEYSAQIFSMEGMRSPSMISDLLTSPPLSLPPLIELTEISSGPTPSHCHIRDFGARRHKRKPSYQGHRDFGKEPYLLRLGRTPFGPHRPEENPVFI
jgi:hypothetical protein